MYALIATTPTHHCSEVERDMVKKSRKIKTTSTMDCSQVGSISHVESVVHRLMALTKADMCEYMAVSMLAQIHPGISMEGLLSQLGLNTPLPPPESSLTHHISDPQTSDTVPGAPSDDRFILVGLHTCGDLAPTVLRVYVQSRQVVGLLSVGCCYMKLSCRGEAGHTSCAELQKLVGDGERGGSCISESDTDSGEVDTQRDALTGGVIENSHVKQTNTDCGSTAPPGKVWGYPMSECLSKLPVSHTELSYEAREVACHSLEAYRERLEGEAEKDPCVRFLAHTMLGPDKLTCTVISGQHCFKLVSSHRVYISVPADLTNMHNIYTQIALIM